MAIRAFHGRRFVKQNEFPLNFTQGCVALFAAHMGVPASQCKLRALIVIECRWRPALVGMALRAFGYSIFRSKLAAMRIHVARFAILRCAFELNFVSAWK